MRRDIAWVRNRVLCRIFSTTSLDGTKISLTLIAYTVFSPFTLFCTTLKFSNVCPTPSQREDLMREIERLRIPGPAGVDAQFFGKCVDREVNITEGTAMKRLAATNGFLFVAEEEICDDFVSEGFYRALNLSYIPVVFGGRDVGFDEVALAGSYVDAFDFDDGREIIQFLRYVSQPANQPAIT